MNVESIKELFEQQKGYSKYNNMHLESLTKEEAVLYADINENSLNPSEIVHGGLIFGLADNAMGTLAYSTGRKVVTVNSSINYLRPCRGKRITCVATPVKVGLTIGVYEAKIYDEEQELAATVSGTYFFLDHDIPKK